MQERVSKPSFGLLAGAYCCAVIVGSLIGAVTILGSGMAASIAAGELSILRVPFIAAFVAADFFPFLFVAALPFTIVATLLLRGGRSGWPSFILLGALCPATVVFILTFLLGTGQDWDFSTVPPRRLDPDGWRLLATSLTFAPAGAAAGAIYWLIGFSRPRVREARP